MAIEELLANSDAVGVVTRHLPDEKRRKVFISDSYTCLYCEMTFPEEELEVDHVKPWVMEQKHERSNLFTACWKCNRRKGRRSILDWCVREYGPEQGTIRAWGIGRRIFLKNFSRPLSRL